MKIYQEMESQTTPFSEQGKPGPGNIFSKLPTMTQSAQTTVSLNRHKALGLSCSRIRW